MGQARLKRQHAPHGNAAVHAPLPNGAPSECPPLANRGGKIDNPNTEAGNVSGTDRLRINLSVPEGLHEALSNAANQFGTSVSQMALMAIVAGLPSLSCRVEIVKGLRASE